MEVPTEQIRRPLAEKKKPKWLGWIMGSIPHITPYPSNIILFVSTMVNISASFFHMKHSILNAYHQTHSWGRENIDAEGSCFNVPFLKVCFLFSFIEFCITLETLFLIQSRQIKFFYSLKATIYSNQQISVKGICSDKSPVFSDVKRGQNCK